MEAPLSNRGQNQGVGAFPVLSIDKISVCTDIPSPEENINFWKCLDYFIVNGGGLTCFGSGLYENAYKFEDWFLEFGKGIADKKGKKLRVEFNPNKFNQGNKLHHFFYLFEKWLKVGNVSRIDWAFDFGFQVDPLCFYDKGKHKNSVFFGKKGKGAETVYIGSRSSDVQFRIYNKKLELAECQEKIVEGDWWRCECTERNSRLFLCSKKVLTNPFRNLLYFQIPKKTEGLQFFFWHFASQYGIQSAFSYLKVNNFKYLKDKLEPDENLNMKKLFEDQSNQVWKDFQEEIGYAV